MKSRAYIWSFLALTAVYVTLTLTLPSNPKTLEKFQISQGEARLLGLAVVIPLVLIYLMALYGSVRVKRYAASIEKTNEGKSFKHISNGLTVLAYSLPAVAVISSLLTYTAWHSPDLLPAVTIARSYLALIIPLVAFILIEKGASGLIQTLRNKKLSPPPLFNTLGVIILSSLYVWLLTTREPVENGGSTYFLPNWLAVTTLAIPYLYIWCKGIMAAYYLFVYQDRVNGSVYKYAIKYLSLGVGTIVFSSVFIQALSTISAQINRLDLGPILLIIYVLLAIYAVGYGLVARGAKRLKKIEEV
jgi:hypothetical protein